MVYFMQSVAGGAIKIGYSENVERRRRQLENMYGTSMAVLAVRDGDQDEEARVHAMFDHLRIDRTEQFQPSPELFAYIGRPLLACANAKVAERMPSTEKPVIVLRCRKAYKEWLKAYADAERSTPAQLIDKAMVLLAEKLDFRPPPFRL